MGFRTKNMESLANDLENKESVHSFKVAIKGLKSESCPFLLFKTYLRNIFYV